MLSVMQPRRERQMEDAGTELATMVCPTAEELSVIVNNVQCVHCGLNFRNEPQLRLHDLKVHQRRGLDKTVKENVRYHCPAASCIYAPESQRYFTTMKYLKQHYLKVHAAKTFACTSCVKCFPTEAAKDAHVRVCGIEFTCSCQKTFSTYEALLTHARRYFHTVDEKYKPTVRRTNAKSLQGTVPLYISFPRGVKPISILPNHGELGISNSTVQSTPKFSDIAVQTDEIKKSKRTPSPSKGNTGKRQVSRQTQTSILPRDKRYRRSAETQTGDDFVSKKLTDVSKVRRRRKNNVKKVENSVLQEDFTFAESFVSENLFPNSPLPLRHDIGLQDLWEDKSTLGTQTSPEKNLFEALNDNVTQTDLVSFYTRVEPTLMHCASQTTNLTALPYNEDAAVIDTFTFVPTSDISRVDPLLIQESFDSRFSSIETQTEQGQFRSLFDSEALSGSFIISTNIETQTTENFENIEQLLYSNTCTQTCDEILPSDLILSNNQTQTAWSQLHDTTVSTETQTKSLSSTDNSISMTPRSWLSTQTSHTETQTDLLSMLEEFQ
ncbi:uncharacterized protein LOC105700105 isoform X2 [Orussus abietinus]|nr:uncharacterized protein LOC105700105 isoform X2 [Orussus abietinus]